MRHQPLTGSGVLQRERFCVSMPPMEGCDLAPPAHTCGLAFAPQRSLCVPLCTESQLAGPRTAPGCMYFPCYERPTNA